MDYFEDEVVIVPSFKLPYWSVKRFYGLFEAHGLFIRNKAKRKAEVRQAISTLAVIAMERADTLDELSRYDHQVTQCDDISVKLHLVRLNSHLESLDRLQAHLSKFSVAYCHERLGH